MIKGKQILVTGGCGFIGSHLIEKLVSQGNTVECFDKYNFNNNWGWLEHSKYKDKIKITLSDIRDYDAVSKSVKGKDIVFHLAALIGIPYSYVSPLAYIRTNIEGTYNVLESARNIGVDQVLVTSTSETYGTAQYVPIDEKHPLVGQSPYSASKISADQIAISYFRSFDLPVKLVRPFNTYGPRQSLRAIIPTIISQALMNKGKINIGSLTPTRDLTYVEDTCKGFEAIAEIDDFLGEVVNIGSHKEISIKELALLISEIMNITIKLSEDSDRVRPKNSEVERLVCDNSKIINTTNWIPEVSLRQGLETTIDWFSNQENTLLFKPNTYNV